MGLLKRPAPSESNDPKRPPKGEASTSRPGRKKPKKDDDQPRITTLHDLWGTR